MHANNNEIDVLLATFNGAKFLSEFLDSLAQQEYVRIHLFVSDDGSTDHTLQIIESYEGKFESLEILHGPKAGPAANFLSLLSCSKSQLIAFADQDDIWEKDHLINSIRRLEGLDSMPALTFCDVSEFYSDGRRNRVWPNLRTEPSITHKSVQNFARGCTMVFNRAAKNLMLERPNLDMIMHDWWMYLLISSCGIVNYSNTVEIHYRVHSGNFIGVDRKSRSLQSRFQSPWTTIHQIGILLESYGSKMKSTEMEQLLNFHSIFLKKASSRFLDILRLRERLRSNLFDEIKIRIAIVLLPFEVTNSVTSQNLTYKVQPPESLM
jgi:glycosyltransferase involved in cell wall biosynthesis